MSEIKVGSRVKLTKPTYKWRSWVDEMNIHFIDEMNKSVNKEFIIESVKYHTDTDVLVGADSYLRNGTVKLVDDLFIYPLDCFELVEENKMSFKVGDRVRVVKRVNEENGWKNGWVNVMSEAIGKINIIQRIDEYGVYFKSSESNRNDYGYGFPPSSLELVADVTLSPKFKVGDQVRVVKRVTEENGWKNCWTTMDKYIGTVQTIRDICSTGVYFTSNDFGFPPSSLELYVEPKSTVQSQDPIIKYQYLKGNRFLYG